MRFLPMAESKKTGKVQKTWRDAISTSEKILTLTAIWPMKNTNFLDMIKIVVSMLATILFILSNVVELRNILIKQDYEVLSTHLSTLGLYIGYSVKIIIFYYKKEVFQKVLKIIESPIFEDCPPAMQKYKDTRILASNRTADSYIYFVAASVFLYLIKPLYTDYNIPIPFSYDLNLVTYTLMVGLQCFACYYLVIVGICFDMITIGLVNIAMAQLNILSETIATFKPKGNVLEDEERIFFRKCVQKHEIIIRFVNETENVFTFIALTQSLASTSSICNAAFQLTHTEELLSVHFFFNCSFAFNVLFEIGICCWFGSLLTIKSPSVSDACFNYNWIDSSTHTRKLLLIIMSRSQKPLYLTAGKFARLSMASFLKILKTAYSYFAVMQTLYDEKNEQI